MKRGPLTLIVNGAHIVVERGAGATNLSSELIGVVLYRLSVVISLGAMICMGFTVVAPVVLVSSIPSRAVVLSTGEARYIGAKPGEHIVSRLDRVPAASVRYRNL